jgi:hypothetical protein
MSDGKGLLLLLGKGQSDPKGKGKDSKDDEADSKDMGDAKLSAAKAVLKAIKADDAERLAEAIGLLVDSCGEPDADD